MRHRTTSEMRRSRLLLAFATAVFPTACSTDAEPSTLAGNTSITRIETDPETFADGAFGFSFVEVRVLNAADETVFFSGALAQTNFRVDLNVPVPQDTQGNRVVLSLIGHEDPSCGGFAEFRVFGLRD